MLFFKCTDESSASPLPQFQLISLQRHSVERGHGGGQRHRRPAVCGTHERSQHGHWWRALPDHLQRYNW